MTSSFQIDKNFGDKLEKNVAIKIIKKMHPGCIIKSPDSYRIDGKAVPDHIVVKDKKVVAFYDSKNKNAIYNVKGHEPFFSTDEKHLDYRYFAEKNKVPCWLIFYCEKHDAHNVYLADIHTKPKFYQLKNNKFGKHWYGYYVSQCKKFKISTKQTVNFDHNDVFKIVEIAQRDLPKAIDMAWELRNRWLDNIQGRSDKLKDSLDNFSYGLRNVRTVNDLMKLLINFESAGKKLNMACSQVKKY